MQYTLKATNKKKNVTEFEYSSMGVVQDKCWLTAPDNEYSYVSVDAKFNNYIMKVDGGDYFSLACWINVAVYLTRTHTQLDLCRYYGKIHVKEYNSSMKSQTQFYELIDWNGEHYVMYPTPTDVRGQVMLRIYKQEFDNTFKIIACVTDYATRFRKLRTYSSTVCSSYMDVCSMLFMFYERLRNDTAPEHQQYVNNLNVTRECGEFLKTFPEDIDILNISKGDNRLDH